VPYLTLHSPRITLSLSLSKLLLLISCFTHAAGLFSQLQLSDWTTESSHCSVSSLVYSALSSL